MITQLGVYIIGEVSTVIFSVTEIGTYMRCRQKWDLTSFNRQGLEPIYKAPALSLGTLWHKTKEDWATRLYLNGEAYDTVDPVAIYDAHANTMYAQSIKRYKESVGVNPSGVELRKVLDAIELGKQMVINYKAYWKEPVPSDMRLIMPEQTIIVPIPGTEHVVSCECEKHPELDMCACELEGKHIEGCKCKIEPHYLEATLDGLMVHRVTNVYYIMENKTFGVHPSIEELQRNWQFICYIWATREHFKEDVRGIAYDGVWKRAHIPCDAKTGKPKRRSDGQTYTDADLFLRTTLVRSLYELAQMPTVLAHYANEMGSIIEGNGPPITRHVPPVKGCVLDCKENIKLCDAIWRGEDTSYILWHYGKREKNYTLKDEDE